MSAEAVPRSSTAKRVSLVNLQIYSFCGFTQRGGENIVNHMGNLK